MPESLGTKLRVAREAKSLTVEQLSAMTKISPAFISAIESGRWDLLPGRVYLKPFTKLCAEALGLDVNELYEIIDGAMPEDRKKYELPAGDSSATAPSGRRIDYKLPIVAISILIIILLISFAVKTKQFGIGGAKREPVVSARAFIKRGEVKWERPWERPSSTQFAGSQRLRLETTCAVSVMVVADQDTIFKEMIPAQSGKTFFAVEEFKVSLSRNDCVTAYLNGLRVPEIGVGSRKLSNFRIAPVKEEEQSPDEAK